MPPGSRSASPSRLYYGWVVAGTLAITETVSWGVLYYAFSVFLVPMQRELGWSTATLTGAYSLALLVSGLAAPFVGRWLDRHGPRALMAVGSAFGALLVVAWSRVDSLALYYVVWAGIGLAMAATLYEPAFATVTKWFERDRGRALLVVTIAAGFASTIALPLSGWLEDRFGWRTALLILAGLLAATTVLPHALLLRRRPEDLGLHPDGVPPHTPATELSPAAAPRDVQLRDALRDPAFRWLTIAFFLETFSMVAVGVHLIPYLTERGDGARFAAAATGLIGAAQVGARVMSPPFWRTTFAGRADLLRLRPPVRCPHRPDGVADKRGGPRRRPPPWRRTWGGDANARRADRGVLRSCPLRIDQRDAGLLPDRRPRPGAGRRWRRLRPRRRLPPRLRRTRQRQPPRRIRHDRGRARSPVGVGGFTL